MPENPTTYVILYDPATDLGFNALYEDQSVINGLKNGGANVILVKTTDIKSIDDLINVIPLVGDVELIINTHQGMGVSLIGTEPDLSAYNVDIYSRIPDNVSVVRNIGCFSESHIYDADYLPLGTMVFGAVGERQLDFAEWEVESVKEFVSADVKDLQLEILENNYGQIDVKFQNYIEAQRAMLLHINQDKSHVHGIEEYTAVQRYWLNAKDLFPDRFAISGYGIIDLDDEMKKLSENHKKIQQSAIDAVSTIFENVPKETVQVVAEKIAKGDEIPFDEYQIALALMLRHLDDSGQIASWQYEARNNSQYSFNRDVRVSTENYLYQRISEEEFVRLNSILMSSHPELMQDYVGKAYNAYIALGNFDKKTGGWDDFEHLWLLDKAEVIDIFFAARSSIDVRDKNGELITMSNVEQFVSKYRQEYRDEAKELIVSLIEWKDSEQKLRDVYNSESRGLLQYELVDSGVPTRSNAYGGLQALRYMS